MRPSQIVNRFVEITKIAVLEPDKKPSSDSKEVKNHVGDRFQGRVIQFEIKPWTSTGVMYIKEKRNTLATLFNPKTFNIPFFDFDENSLTFKHVGGLYKLKFL